jgi:hypothetical protein
MPYRNAQSRILPSPEREENAPVLSPSPSPRRRSPGAARKRRWKERRRRGEAVYTIVVNEHAIADALIESGRLSDSATRDRGATERALADVLADWAALWR